MRKVQIAFLLAGKYLSRYSLKLLGRIRSRSSYQGYFYQTQQRSAKSNFFYLIQKQRIWLTLVTILLVSLVFIPTFSIWSNASTGVLSEGIVGLHDTQNLPINVTSLISKPLITLDKTGKPRGELVESWQVNNNSTIYTFKLRDNIYWSDGSKLKSSDIKVNLLNSETSYPDESQIVVNLKESYSNLPSLLTSPIFKKDTLIGIGPYIVESEERLDKIVTKLRLRSLNKDLPEVIIRFYPDEETLAIAYYLGEIDSLITQNSVESYSDQSGNVIQTKVNYQKIAAIFYNTKDNILSDRNLRKALNAATPKIEGEQRAKTSINPESWVFNKELRDNLDNKDLSLDYLNRFLQNGKLQSLTLITTPSLASTAEEIIKAWKEIGITAVLRVESGIPQNFQALLTTQTIPADPDQYLLWHSSQVNTNLSKFGSPRVDRDLEEARKSNNNDLKKDMYLDLQKVLSDEAPATFLYFPKLNIVYREKVKDLIEKVLPLQTSNL